MDAIGRFSFDLGGLRNKLRSECTLFNEILVYLRQIGKLNSELEISQVELSCNARTYLKKLVKKDFPEPFWKCETTTEGEVIHTGFLPRAINEFSIKKYFDVRKRLLALRFSVTAAIVGSLGAVLIENNGYPIVLQTNIFTLTKFTEEEIEYLIQLLLKKHNVRLEKIDKRGNARFSFVESKGSTSQ